MYRKLHRLLVVVWILCLSVTGVALAAEVHWSYEGEDGPEHWGDLSPEFAACSTGMEQSPIDIASSSPSNGADLQFNYQPSALTIVNNGHTIQANYDEGSTLQVDGQTYELLQLHFHNPSEHTVDGSAAPMEMHLVHKNRAGGLAVVGVLLVEGEQTLAYSPIFDNMPASKGEPIAVDGVTIRAADLLPDDQSYWRYAGSLTTPPCSEGVKWFVMTTPVEVGADQIAAYTSLYSGNARSAQPMNERDFIVGQIRPQGDPHHQIAHASITMGQAGSLIESAVAMSGAVDQLVGAIDSIAQETDAAVEDGDLEHAGVMIENAINAMISADESIKAVDRLVETVVVMVGQTDVAVEETLAAVEASLTGSGDSTDLQAALEALVIADEAVEEAVAVVEAADSAVESADVQMEEALRLFHVSDGMIEMGLTESVDLAAEAGHVAVKVADAFVEEAVVAVEAADSAIDAALTAIEEAHVLVDTAHVPAEGEDSNEVHAMTEGAQSEESHEMAEDKHGEEEHAIHWSYEGERGPEHWGDLDAAYEACGIGVEQSPIDLTAAEMTDLENIVFHYGESDVNILNNGHTIQVNYDEGSDIAIGGHPYDLLQFHFHAPSEHAVDGNLYPAEMHLVHADAGGNLAVVGVFIAEGAENAAFKPVWDALPAEETEAVATGMVVNASELLPAEQVIFRYGGSLTTPPCSEGVLWSVMESPVELSAEQIAAFTDIFQGNNRPLQPLNDRLLLLDETP